MPTIYSRLVLYQKLTKQPPLTQQQRRDLGQIIIHEYFQFDIQAALHRVTSKEPEGNFTVLSYPKFYIHELDRLIKDFYDKNATKIVPKRKRISTTAVWSAKPSNRT